MAPQQIGADKADHSKLVFEGFEDHSKEDTCKLEVRTFRLTVLGLLKSA